MCSYQHKDVSVCLLLANVLCTSADTSVYVIFSSFRDKYFNFNNKYSEEKNDRNFFFICAITTTEILCKIFRKKSNCNMRLAQVYALKEKLNGRSYYVFKAVGKDETII